MSSQECIFCKIAAGELPAKVHFESDLVLAIDNVHPTAPVHKLILPKKHYMTMADVESADPQLPLEMWMAVWELNKRIFAPGAFNIIVNNGKEAGQQIMHLHWHFLAGKNIYQAGFHL
ncbi:HIT domain-containing protein [bacterium]|nr:HIT domain-containing protein [bacterium]